VQSLPEMLVFAADIAPEFVAAFASPETVSAIYEEVYVDVHRRWEPPRSEGHGRLFQHRLHRFGHHRLQRHGGDRKGYPGTLREN
jgi:hypothetical protein